MKRKALYGFLSLLLIFNLVVGVKVFTSRAAADSDDAGYENLTVFTRALQLIRQDYVDANKIAYKELTYSALRGMLGSLDPHSQFMEPTDYRDMQSETRSEFGGLGIVVSTKDAVLTVVSPMEDSPGFRAGISPGDQILRINGTTTEKMSLQDAINLLRGDPGQKVTLTIFRTIEQGDERLCSAKGNHQSRQRQGRKDSGSIDHRKFQNRLCANYPV